MKVHVICCNDSVQSAVIEDEMKAVEKMAELKSEHYEQNRWFYSGHKEYDTRCYWHIHTVEGEE